VPKGWMGTILEIDLSEGSITERDTMPHVEHWLGGRALADRLAWEAMPHDVNWDEADSVVCIATGPLTGTLAPTSGRVVMTGLSPRTYPHTWYTHSTLGGWFGPALKYAGYDALIIRGCAPEPVYLEITDRRVHLRSARELWGSDARATQLELRRRLGTDAQVMTIGPAGEHRVRFATVQHGEENAAGHSGFGAVWGSKRLKAIAACGARSIEIADPEGLLALVREHGIYKGTPLGGNLSDAASRNEHRPVCSQACTFNCRLGQYARLPDGRRMPGFCIGGSVWVGNGMRLTHYEGGGVRVPPAVNFPEQDPKLHELCNRLGLDLWFRLVMQPWFLRCVELGITEIRGYPLAPDDPDWFEAFIYDLAYRRNLGALFADDLRRAMDTLEGELPDELIRLGCELEFDFGFPAHREGRFWDEEPLPFWVISLMMHATFSRDPTIGTHQSSLLLADILLEDPQIARRQFRVLSQKVWGYPDALEPTMDNKAPVAVWSQNQQVIIDSLPLCDFAFPQLVRDLGGKEAWRNAKDITGDLDWDRRFLGAVTGKDFSRGDLDRIAQRAFNLERVMLAARGRCRAMEEELAAHFSLPCRADGTTTDLEGFRQLLAEYYAARNWDLEFGWPTDEKLSELGLEEAIPLLRRLRMQSRLGPRCG